MNTDELIVFAIHQQILRHGRQICYVRNEIRSQSLARLCKQKTQYTQKRFISHFIKAKNTYCIQWNSSFPSSHTERNCPLELTDGVFKNYRNPHKSNHYSLQVPCTKNPQHYHEFSFLHSINELFKKKKTPIKTDGNKSFVKVSAKYFSTLGISSYSISPYYFRKPKRIYLVASVTKEVVFNDSFMDC